MVPGSMPAKVLAQVGAADGAAGHAQDRVGRFLNLRLLDIVQADIADAMEDNSFHQIPSGGKTINTFSTPNTALSVFCTIDAALVTCSAMIKVNCHSLWLVPRGAVHLDLGEIIRALSQRYGTPRFAPHVTLLGQTLKPRREIIAITREVASEHDAIPIELTQPAYTSDYVRSLFIEAEPSNALLAARELAVERFGMSVKYDFRPHLSLLYGDLSEAQKQAIIANLGSNFPRRFFAESIDVYATEGRPEQWRLVESVALTGAAREKSGGE